MPIDFPTSPVSGQTYSYGINRWIYNGVAWDKLDNHPGIGVGNQTTVGYTESLSGATFTVNVVEGAGSDLDADLIHGVSGQRFLENLQTGLLYGGLLSINSGNSAAFDLTAGAGIIVSVNGSTTGYPTPTVTNVTWTAKTGVTLSNLVADPETFISINSSGNIVQQSTAWTDTEYETQIPIGTLFHSGTAYIDLAIGIPHLAYGQAQQFDPFIRAFGPLKLNGYELSANGANLQINKSSGKSYLMGRNYATDPDNPNIITDTASNPVVYYYMFYRDNSGGFNTTIRTTGTDVAYYDDGTGTLAAVPGGKYTTQRMFGLPNQPNVIGVYYGRELYNSIDEAKANLSFESFSESDSTSIQGVFLGYLVVKGNATALNVSVDAEFVAAGLFRNTSNIGGGGLAFATLDDLSDVSISSPANNQALIYDSSTSLWTNKSFSSLPVVTSFNGLTGAVTGVSSIRGLTGAVGLTNGSGIDLSVSGNTLTVSNTGVLSFNGLTGAVTGVTTGTANTFGPLQSFTNGISSAGGTFSALTRFTAGISASGGATLSGNVNIPSGSTLTVNGNFVANGNVNLGDAVTDAITVTGLLAANGGLSAAGGTFSALTRFTAGISASGGMTLSGILNLNGVTFDTNIAKTNVNNNFSETQTILGDQKTLVTTHYKLSPLTLKYLSIEPYNNRITYNDAINGYLTYLTFDSSTVGTFTVNVPNYSTTLAGLAGTQTFTGTNTFSSLANFSAGISSAGGTFSALTRFTAGISASGGATLSGTINIPTGSTLYVPGIQGSKSILEIDTEKVASRVAIGDYYGVGNGVYIFLRNSISALDISNPYGQINFGDPDARSTGNYIYYYPDEATLYSGSGNDVIAGFLNIYANNGFYETSNSIRVTNNARSWFI